MKTLSEYLFEAEEEDKDKDETINSEKEFRAAAKAKFEEVFGDDLDEERMNMTIKGILDDHKDLVDAGNWAELIGILNQSFASK